MASRLIAQGHQVETVQLLLGHAELDHVRRYLAISQQKLSDMFAAVI
jgi:site-specific recombinase XerD